VGGLNPRVQDDFIGLLNLDSNKRFPIVFCFKVDQSSSKCKFMDVILVGAEFYLCNPLCVPFLHCRTDRFPTQRSVIDGSKAFNEVSLFSRALFCTKNILLFVQSHDLG